MRMPSGEKNVTEKFINGYKKKNNAQAKYRKLTHVVIISKVPKL